MKDARDAWPYANEAGQEETVVCDVLVLGGGLSGCFAAIAAARQGQKVVLVEKGAVERSGAAGTGFDHWELACTNPCSKVTPEEIAWAYVREQDGYSNESPTILNAGKGMTGCWIWNVSEGRSAIPKENFPGLNSGMKRRG